MSTTTLPIIFDKSHLVTLGEKLYQEGVELIRELVCNAYDADAMNVWIEVDQYQIKVRDDGSGMDMSGLKQYLTIGSEEKKHNHRSFRFERERIGQFGIGKFAVLSASSVFKVHTQKEDFAAQLVFDEVLWKTLDGWDVPIHSLDFDPLLGNGTTVILERLKKSFTLPQIERAIRERTPLKAPHFRVFLNTKQIEPYKIPGKVFQVSEDTEFGTIRGEIILPHFSQKVEHPGIEITVKGVMIQRMTFGQDRIHDIASGRLIGTVEAGFLPVTSDRTRFLMDSDFYMVFVEVMEKVVRKILRSVKDEQRIKIDQKADRVLRDALRSMRRAMKKNGEFAPVTMVPSAEEEPSSLMGNAPGDGAIGEGLPEELLNGERDHRGLSDGGEADPRIKKVKVRNKQGEEMIARKIKVGDVDVICTFEELGSDVPEYLNEGGVIIINRSHRMYRRVEKKEELLGEYILRLISQELSRQHYPADATKALDLVNQLLRDAVM